jgi:hypothetical protein
MMWPGYPLPTKDSALLRYNARLVDSVARGAPARYAIAADVWRGGAHLWRSYNPIHGESVDAYALRTLGPLYPTDHDNGLWGVPGVDQVADWPVPTLATLAGPLSLQAVHDALCAWVALAQLPGEPYALDQVPTQQVLTQRMARTDSGFIVVALRAGDVSVRAMVARYHCAARKSPDLVLRQFTARLVRRESRMPAHLTETAEIFEILTDGDDSVESVRQIVRAAKAVLGVRGRPAARDFRQPGLVWRLTGEPHDIVIKESKSCN